LAKVVAVVGSSGSGKTHTIEYLISGLTKRGLKVGSAKHVHHPDFTIDVEGKDTWRHTKAGSRRVVCLAEDEVTVIRKEHGQSYSLEMLLDLFGDEEFDIIILEGFHWLVSKRGDVEKIVTAKDGEDLKKRLEGTSPPILGITGIVANDKKLRLESGIPVIDIVRDGERLVEMVATATL